MQKSKKSVVDFLFEVGILSKTPRSGFHFLGSGHQSVAEHTNRTVFIGYVLATLDGTVDSAKVMKMCLFHDMAEARTSDLNYVHQKYAKADDEKAIEDLVETVPFGQDIVSAIHEFKERKTKEALLAKDADNLEWILSLKEQVDTGNARAKTWLPSAVKRLRTDIAKEIAAIILKTDSDHWWFAKKDDQWWVTRDKKIKK
jgi:putative hydrolase of HD superfamily